MRTLRVELGRRSYPVIIGSGALGEVSTVLSDFGGFDRLAIVADRGVEALYAERLEGPARVFAKTHRLVIEPGESSKSWGVAGELLEKLAARGFTRTDVVVTLGGGVASDLGGFVAAAYLRGIKVIHAPTTLLGQVDAAIGGKTGVNLTAGKNLSGAFYQPVAVLSDIDTLASLPEREYRSGLAEVIKYGLCYEPGILECFEAGTDNRCLLDEKSPDLLEDLVFKCASIKGRVVAADEHDRDGRLILNYGHTFGHALEAAGEFGRWSHGEAISVGMVFASVVSCLEGLAGPDLVDRHRDLFTSAGLPISASFDPQELEKLWLLDKKRDRVQRWILLEDLGKPKVCANVSIENLQKALQEVMA